METIKFVHKVSRGSRFNQVYIPKSMEKDFEAGDIVEVTLLEKKSSLHYSPNIPKLSDFKLKLIKSLFLELLKFKEINQVFLVGSFLTQKSEYNDIDILIIAKKDLEKKIYELLLEKFELKFHIMVINEKNFEYLQKSCPLTRSMLYFFVSNKHYSLPKETQIDKSHIKFLLMMPQDILKLKLKSRIFYDSIRRLITIERFLENKEINPLDIEEEIKTFIGESLTKNIKLNEDVSETLIKKLKKIIKTKLDEIEKKIR